MKLNEEDIQRIEAQTRGQSSNQWWGRFRYGRFTASNFSRLLTAANRGNIPPSTMKAVTNEYDLSTLPGVQWGKHHEQVALRVYCQAMGCTVAPCGIVLGESGVFGASPDGLVGDDVILEVKCPFSLRDTGILRCLGLPQGKLFIKPVRDSIEQVTLFRITDAECAPDHHVYVFQEGDVVLDESSALGKQYVNQVQGCLALTRRSQCHFIVWTPSETVIFVLSKDDSWEKRCLPLLQELYANKFIPYLCEKHNIPDV